MYKHEHDSMKFSLLVSIENKNLHTSGFKFPKISEIPITTHEALSSSVDYPTNPSTCSKEEISKIPDASCDRALLENSSTEATIGVSDVTQPSIPRKEKLESYSTNLKQIVLSLEEGERLDHNLAGINCTPSRLTFLRVIKAEHISRKVRM